MRDERRAGHDAVAVLLEELQKRRADFVGSHLVGCPCDCSGGPPAPTPARTQRAPGTPVGWPAKSRSNGCCATTGSVDTVRYSIVSRAAGRGGRQRVRCSVRGGRFAAAVCTGAYALRWRNAAMQPRSRTLAQAGSGRAAAKSRSSAMVSRPRSRLSSAAASSASASDIGECRIDGALRQWRGDARCFDLAPDPQPAAVPQGGFRIRAIAAAVRSSSMLRSDLSRAMASSMAAGCAAGERDAAGPEPRTARAAPAS